MKLQLQQQQQQQDGIVYQVILRLHIYERGIYQETIHSRNNTETDRRSIGGGALRDQMPPEVATTGHVHTGPKP